MEFTLIVLASSHNLPIAQASVYLYVSVFAKILEIYKDVSMPWNHFSRTKWGLKINTNKSKVTVLETVR